MGVGERIRKKRLELNITLEELGLKTKVNKTTILRYENGTISNIPSDKIEIIAQALNTTPAYLMGWDTHPPAAPPTPFNDAMLIEMPPTIEIPVYGKIGTGIAIEEIEDIEEIIDIPADWMKNGKKFIGLRVEGDSMYPHIFEDDIVIIEITHEFNSGDTCAVYANGCNVAIKEVKKIDGGVKLIPINTQYPPKKYKTGEYSVLGVIRQLRRDL